MKCRWVHKAPHLPPPELEDALFNAAYHDGAHGLHASTGMVIAAAGASHPLASKMSLM